MRMKLIMSAHLWYCNCIVARGVRKVFTGTVFYCRPEGTEIHVLRTKNQRVFSDHICTSTPDLISCLVSCCADSNFKSDRVTSLGETWSTYTCGARRPLLSFFVSDDANAADRNMLASCKPFRGAQHLPSAVSYVLVEGPLTRNPSRLFSPCSV